jgi:hypothetical protein
MFIHAYFQKILLIFYILINIPCLSVGYMATVGRSELFRGTGLVS